MDTTQMGQEATPLVWLSELLAPKLFCLTGCVFSAASLHCCHCFRFLHNLSQVGALSKRYSVHQRSQLQLL
jgi:hypothetical protein